MSGERVEYGATAFVTVSIEVEASGSWGATCTVEQIHRQAGDETMNAIRSALVTSLCKGGNRARLVGEPSVTIVHSVRKKT